MNASRLGADATRLSSPFLKEPLMLEGLLKDILLLLLPRLMNASRLGADATRLSSPNFPFDAWMAVFTLRMLLKLPTFGPSPRVSLPSNVDNPSTSCVHAETKSASRGSSCFPPSSLSSLSSSGGKNFLEPEPGRGDARLAVSLSESVSSSSALWALCMFLADILQEGVRGTTFSSDLLFSATGT